MTSKEALEEIKDWVEYFTRLDYVEPIVRDEVKQKFKDAYWGTLGHFEKIEKDLKVLEILKKHFRVYFDDETENGLEDKVFSGIDLDDIWSGGYDEDFEKIMEWLENE